MAAMNKANARQSSRRKGYYASQRDVTPVNKAIKVARHIARYGDVKQKNVLRKLPKLTLDHAARKIHNRQKASGTAGSLGLANDTRNVLFDLAA